jgi:hypothetical protein
VVWDDPTAITFFEADSTVMVLAPFPLFPAFPAAKKTLAPYKKGKRQTPVEK